MAEDRQLHFLHPASGSPGEGVERLSKAVKRIETLLEKTLADYHALRREHQQLTLDYHALKARTEAVGDEMDATIERLKQWIAENEGGADGEGPWAR